MSTYETRKQAQKTFYALNQNISSDDPDALMKLRQKREFLEEKRQDMKRLNAAYRKGGWAAVPELSDKAVALLKRDMDRAPYL